jgi:hypothetical protein
LRHYEGLIASGEKLFINFASALALLGALHFFNAEAVEIGRSFSLSESYTTGDVYMGIRLLGVLKLKGRTVNGLKLQELSGLAWDADQNILYAVSDDGFIVHLRPTFSEGVLSGIDLVAAHLLRDAAGRPCEETMTDAEGLVARAARNGTPGDTELVVSFERRPRISVFRPDGELVRDITLPSSLRDIEGYSGDNHELEALTEHQHFGLITAPERPLKAADPFRFTLYSLDGKEWTYPPLDAEYSTLAGLESMPDGDLLVLERRFSSIFKPVIFALRRMSLPRDGENPDRPVREVVHFDTSKGWAVDNFEAIARHEGNRYFMVSDDNDSMLQKTLLLYFEILEEPPE